MHIAVDIRHLAAPNLSGIGQYTLHLIRTWAAEVPHTTFTLFAAGTKKATQHLPAFNAPNVHLHISRIPNRVLSGLVSTPNGKPLESFLDEQPDMWLFPNLNFIRTNLPYALTVHDASFHIYPEFFSYKTRLWHRLTRFPALVQNAAHLFCVSERTKRDVQQIWHIDPDRMSVTHLGVSHIFQPRERPSDKTHLRDLGIRFPYILTLSTLEPRKNIPSLIKAYDRWRTDTKNAPHLVIAGGNGWKTAALTRAYHASPYRRDIHFLGYVPEEKKPALYRHAHTFVFPSYYEGFGLPTAEAMASGTPVITSFTGSMPEVVQDAGVMIDPYNVTDIVQALELMQNPDLRAVCVRRGRERAAQFRWQKTTQTVHNAMHSLLR